MRTNLAAPAPQLNKVHRLGKLALSCLALEDTQPPTDALPASSMSTVLTAAALT